MSIPLSVEPSIRNTGIPVSYNVSTPSGSLNTLSSSPLSLSSNGYNFPSPYQAPYTVPVSAYGPVMVKKKSIFCGALIFFIIYAVIVILITLIPTLFRRYYYNIAAAIVTFIIYMLIGIGVYFLCKSGQTGWAWIVACIPLIISVLLFIVYLFLIFTTNIIVFNKFFYRR